MFEVKQVNKNGFEAWQLSDGKGCTALVVPACGGILSEFCIEHNGSSLNIIDSYASKLEFDTAVESLGFKGCKLSPYVCRMKNGEYKFAGERYRSDGFYLGAHALHGLIYKADFKLEKTNATDEEATVELIFSYKKTDEGYPFSYDCRVIYELKKDNNLFIRTIIKNQTELAIPICDGWHPYFSFGGTVNELLMYFRAPEMLEFDDELIPTGKKLPNYQFQQLERIGDARLDNSFLIDSPASAPVLILQDPAKKIQLEISCDKSYPVLQIYTPDHRRSIAIENLSSAPDAFNNGIGLIALAAGKEAIFSTTYCVRNLQQ